MHYTKKVLVASELQHNATPNSFYSARTALQPVVLVVPVVSALSAIHHAVVFGEKLECNDSVGTQ